MSLSRSLEMKLQEFARTVADESVPSEWEEFFKKIESTIDDAISKKRKVVILETNELKPEDIVQITRRLNDSGSVLATAGINYNTRTMYIRINPIPIY